MTSIYNMASLYTTFFLTKTLKVDATTVNTLVLLATAICLPVFPLAGWLCDRWGRKAVLLAGFVATLVLVFPVFYGLLAYANPALAAAQAKADIRVETDLAGCSLMFNPLGNRKFTSACDTARQALASASVAYRVTQMQVTANAARIRIGDTVLDAYDAAGLAADEAKAHASRLASTLRTALDQYGYPVTGKPTEVNKVMVLVLLVAFFASSILIVMAMGPALVEMFPTRIRYTSMSVPYTLATVWVGGLLPTFVFAISTQTGDLFSGLWYPVGWTLLSLVVVIFFFRETRDIDITADA